MTADGPGGGGIAVTADEAARESPGSRLLPIESGAIREVGDRRWLRSGQAPPPAIAQSCEIA